MTHVLAAPAKNIKIVVDAINNQEVFYSRELNIAKGEFIMFDIAKRNEKGLLVYDKEAVRKFFTEKENALNDEYMEKFRALFDRRDIGEISQEECNSLYEELDNEWTEAFSKLYDEKVGTQPKEISKEKILTPPRFAIA